MPIVAFETPVPANIADIPVCAIDLGFSESDPSVGITCSPATDCEQDEFLFGDGVLLVNSWLENCRRECVLIVEAPLSMAMTASGNPCHRQIELQRNYQPGRSPRSPKGWYYQAGANLSLGSSLFLQKLFVPDQLTVRLIEGFYCSVSPDEGHATHRDVAAHMVACLYASVGQSLVTPLAEVANGIVQLLPGLQGIVSGIPRVLLRDGLDIRAVPQ